jgi:hypothetical protein
MAARSCRAGGSAAVFRNSRLFPVIGFFLVAPWPNSRFRRSDVNSQPSEKSGFWPWLGSASARLKPWTTLPSMQRRNASGLSRAKAVASVGFSRTPSSGTVTAAGVSFKFGTSKPRPTGTINGMPRTGQDLRALATSAGFVVALTGATIAEHHRIVDAGSASDASVVHWRVAFF